MLQTVHVVRSAIPSISGLPPPPPTSRPPPLMIHATTTMIDDGSNYDDDDNVNDDATRQQKIVEYIFSLNRRQLLELFCQCEPPPPPSASSPFLLETTTLSGGDDWDGILLDNHGRFMTSISQFMTHVLFGRGNQWCGKRFGDASATPITKTTTSGINRFRSFSSSSSKLLQHRHRFDYAIQESRLHPGTRSMILDYSPYQSPLSLWYTMRDELRLVPGSNGSVLLGMGSMSWSGGMWNAAPFCLKKCQTTTTSTTTATTAT